LRLPAYAALVLCAGLVACSFRGSSPASAARTTGTPLAKASGQLDAQVAMPSNFPADVPIYPAARLTAEGAFESPGEVAWGMEWETLDPVSKVQAFYARQMSQGDWTINFSDNTNLHFAATFSRKSNSHAGGTLVGDSGSGVTKILMSLKSPR
jgi:hypothetical protein